MKTHNLCATLMAFGLLVAAPAFAQTTPVQKQPTQEGAPSMPGPTGGAFNANPNYKQPTQEGGPSMPGPTGGAFNANPNYKQPTQEGGPSMPGPTGGAFNADPNYKQRTQEGGGPDVACAKPFNANPAGDPDCKQRTQNLSPSPGQALEAGKQK
jgi:hypothetical protein